MIAVKHVYILAIDFEHDHGKKLCLSVKQHAPVMTTEIFDDVTKLKVSSAVKIHV